MLMSWHMAITDSLSHRSFLQSFSFSKPNSLNFKPTQQSLFSPKFRAFRGLSMEDLNDNDAFYLVRKGEMIGIYKSLSDCRAQAGSSVYDPSITVYKGYGMSKEAEEFLRTHGLKNASYSVTVDDAKDNLLGKFGALVSCPFQQPASIGAEAEDADDEDSSPERWEEAAKLIELAEKGGFSSLRTMPSTKTVKQDSATTSLGTPTVSSNRENAVGSSVSAISQTNIFKSDSSINFFGTQIVSSSCDTCIIEFDGASKGNPGLAGAGVVLRAADGSSVWRLREGVGMATNNVAEYRSLLLGMREALKKGFKHIHARGDSKLVVMQVQGIWKLKNPNMAELCTVAKKLAENFISFQIEHVLREYNSAADAQANQAINLRDGEVEEEYHRL